MVFARATGGWPTPMGMCTMADGAVICITTKAALSAKPVAWNAMMDVGRMARSVAKEFASIAVWVSWKANLKMISLMAWAHFQATREYSSRANGLTDVEKEKPPFALKLRNILPTVLVV